MDDRDAASANPLPPGEVPVPTTNPVPATPKKKRSDPGTGGVKDTLESILVAFILAFIFRAFVVEAFVIPTGSMAPTLLGAHMRYTCPDCGYHFDANFSTQSGDDTEIPDHAGPALTSDGRSHDVTYDVQCPNCGLHLPADVNPRVFYGDRILVLKYVYLLQQPQRWDVVVFKSPVDAAKYNYSQNYIKRLVGKPGEWLMVLDGDIYVAPAEDGPYVVQKKTASAQQALWRIIYDNDYHPLNGPKRLTPSGGTKWEQPWRFVDGEGQWDTGDPDGRPPSRAFSFTGEHASGTLEFDPSRNREPLYPAFSDWLAYDQTGGSYNYQGENTVRDLKLQLDYFRDSGAGAMRLRLTKYDDVFIAEFTPDRVTLRHQTASGKLLGEKSAPLPAAIKGSHHVEFSNVDYQVTVRVNDTDLLQTTPEEYHPDVEWLKAHTLRPRSVPPPPTVSISAEDQKCRVEHVGLWRDVYYTLQDSHHSAVRQGGALNPIHLGPDEYFVCGDNSVFSYDARFWFEPINLPDERLKTDAGRVPGRFLLGRAFFVYWPAGYRAVEKLPGLIPDFGEMRFIR